MKKLKLNISAQLLSINPQEKVKQLLNGLVLLKHTNLQSGSILLESSLTEILSGTSTEKDLCNQLRNILDDFVDQTTDSVELLDSQTARTTLQESVDYAVAELNNIVSELSEDQLVQVVDDAILSLTVASSGASLEDVIEDVIFSLSNQLEENTAPLLEGLFNVTSALSDALFRNQKTHLQLIEETITDITNQISAVKNSINNIDNTQTVEYLFNQSKTVLSNSCNTVALFSERPFSIQINNDPILRDIYHYSFTSKNYFSVSIANYNSESINIDYLISSAEPIGSSYVYT